MKKNEITRVNYDDLNLAEVSAFNAKQLALVLKATPRQYQKTRRGKGGENWTYVSGSYVTKVLNLMFGFRWNFEIVSEKMDLDIGQCIIHGRLTVPSNEGPIVKEQFGRCDIKFYKDKRLTPNGQLKPIDVGNDLKAAATDALKKCASAIGIASDIYGGDDFREIQVVDDEPKKPALNEVEEKYQHFILSAKDLLDLETISLGYSEHSAGLLIEDHEFLGPLFKKQIVLLTKNQ